MLILKRTTRVIWLRKTGPLTQMVSFRSFLNSIHALTCPFSSISWLPIFNSRVSCQISEIVDFILKCNFLFEFADFTFTFCGIFVSADCRVIFRLFRFCFFWVISLHFSKVIKINFVTFQRTAFDFVYAHSQSSSNSRCSAFHFLEESDFFIEYFLSKFQQSCFIGFYVLFVEFVRCILNEAIFSYSTKFSLQLQPELVFRNVFAFEFSNAISTRAICIFPSSLTIQSIVGFFVCSHSEYEQQLIFELQWSSTFAQFVLLFAFNFALCNSKYNATVLSINL